jgi:hypothetical protein
MMPDTGRLRTPLKTLLKDSDVFVVMMPYLKPPSSYASAHLDLCCICSSTMPSPQCSIICQFLSFSPQTDALNVHNIGPLPCLQPPSSFGSARN